MKQPGEHGGRPRAELQPVAAPPKLARGVNRLPTEVVLASQQSRIVAGTANAIAAKGYASASVADIIAFAGVSRTTFYQLYKDKESCFLACFEALADSHYEAVEKALAEPLPHPMRLIGGLQAYLGRVDANAQFARAFIGEAEAATPAIREAFLRSRGRLEAGLRSWFEVAKRDHPELQQPSATTFEMVNTGLGGLVVNCARAERPLLPLVPEIAAFVFAGLGMPAWAEHAKSLPPN